MGDPADPDTCGGFLSPKKRAGWRLEGPATLLRRDDFAEPIELGSVLLLLESLLVGGADLDRIAHADVEFNPSVEFNSWLDLVCGAARGLLAASNGQISRMQAALAEGAKRAVADGAISAATYEVQRGDFRCVEDLWIAALAGEADPAAALHSKLPRFSSQLAPLQGALLMSLIVRSKAEGGAVAWAAVEMLMGGRIDRATASKEATFFYSQTGGVAFDGMLEANELVPDFMDAEEAVLSCLQELAARRPPPELRVAPLTLLHAKRALVEAMKVAHGSSHALTMGNVQTAITHFDSLETLAGGAEAAETWSALESLALKLKMPESKPSLALLPLLEARLQPMRDKFEEDRAKPLGAKLLSLMATLTDREEAKAGAGETKGGLAGEGDSSNGKPSAKVGYPRYFQSTLEALVDRRHFIDSSEALRASLESVARGDVHPHTALRLVLEQGETPFLHALFGIKDEVALIPLVKTIADTLPQHGGHFLGYMGLLSLMPAGMADDTTANDATSPTFSTTSLCAQCGGSRSCSQATWGCRGR